MQRITIILWWIFSTVYRKNEFKNFKSYALNNRAPDTAKDIYIYTHTFLTFLAIFIFLKVTRKEQISICNGKQHFSK